MDVVDLPTNVQEFDADERISFSRLDNKFIAVHDNGTEYEFDAERRIWTPTDESVVDASVESRGQGSDASSNRRDRAQVEREDSESSKPARPAKRQKPAPQPKQNTAVYVTGLPDDATLEEVHDLFSRKGGVIAEEIDSGAPRIKMYTDEQGSFKGDALIVFFKPQSVEMAIMLLDDTAFRYSDSGAKQGRMRVQAADSNYKKTKYEEGNAGNGEGKGESAEKRPQKSQRDRQKIIKKTQKLDAKLADWDDDDPYPAPGEAVSKWDKTVILSHMFTLQELDEDPAALLEIKEDIREECAKLGTVTNVVLFDGEPEGIVTVKFQDPESAAACIRLMHGRAFDGRTVEAFYATGKEKFQRSAKDKDPEDSD